MRGERYESPPGRRGELGVLAARAQSRRVCERHDTGLRLYVKKLSNPLTSPSIKNVDNEKKSICRREPTDLQGLTWNSTEIHNGFLAASFHVWYIWCYWRGRIVA